MRFWSWFDIVGCAAVLACGHAAAPQTADNAERTAFVAQRCPALEPAPGPLDLANARVFIEVAEVDRQLPQPIERWLDDNAVVVRSTANLVAFPNVPTSMPWGQCVDAVCASMQRSITLTARLPKLTTEPLTVALRIEESAPEGSATGGKLLLDTTLTLASQQPVVLPPASELSTGSVIVTAYLLQRPDDLHRVLECKVRQGEREKALAR